MSDIDTECAMLSFCEEYKDLEVKIEGTDQHEYGKRHLRIYEPTLLAALVAYCSGRRQQVFLRGSTKNHPFSVPSLLGVALLRRPFFPLFIGIFARGRFLFCSFSRGQNSGQRPPASFGQPARSDH
ncbi:MAG: hypothetical protein OXG04_15980, partial [Acidobacteria bacterium]|nr:hypothetical protein [Acidobacteriota bacterium]